jgi:hypothetical protein
MNVQQVNNTMIPAGSLVDVFKNVTNPLSTNGSYCCPALTYICLAMGTGIVGWMMYKAYQHFCHSRNSAGFYNRGYSPIGVDVEFNINNPDNAACVHTRLFNP